MDHCLLSTLPPCRASLAQGPCPPPDKQEAVCPPSEHRSTCAVPGTQHAMRPAASAHRNGTFPPSRMDGAAWESWPAPHPLHLQPLELQQPWLGGHRSSARRVFSRFLLISARRPARGGAPARCRDAGPGSQAAPSTLTCAFFWPVVSHFIIFPS